MNKQSLATILGVALLGLTKKGSMATKRPLGQYFKKKTGSDSQNFKIYFSLNYNPFWSDYTIIKDFSEYVDQFIDFARQVVNDYESEVNDWDFSDWCMDNDMYWHDDLASDLMDFKDWRDISLVLHNSKFHFDFEPSETADEIEEENIEDMANQAKAIIDDLDEDDGPDWVDNWHEFRNLRDRLYEKGEIGDFDLSWEDEDEFNSIKSQLFLYKDDLKDFIEERKEDIFGYEDDWTFDWEDRINEFSAHLRGYLECRLDLSNFRLPFNRWVSVIEMVLEKGYLEWIREEKPRFGIGTEDFREFSIIKIEPNVFNDDGRISVFNQSKSKLRRR